MARYLVGITIGVTLTALTSYAQTVDAPVPLVTDVPVDSTVIADVRIGTYPINASSIDGLRRAMREVVLPIGGARRAVASTKVTMTPSVTYAELEGQCLVPSAVVELDVLVTLPEWRQREYANATELAAWSAYVTALQRHEELHIRTAERYAERFQSALRGLPPAPDCDVQRARVAQTESDVLDRHRAAQELIDVRVLEGAGVVR